MSKYTVSVTDCRHASYDVEKEILSTISANLVLNNCQTEDEVLEACRFSDGILLDGAPMTKKVIESLQKCKVINRYGVGFDNLDVYACTDKGVWATNVPDYCITDVSEHAIALMTACMRQIAFKDRGIRNGKWNFFYPSIFRLAHKNLGVIGGGKIGQAFIKKVQGFEFEHIFVYDPYKSSEEIAEWGCIKTSIDELLSVSDFVTLHIPLNPETHHLIDDEKIRLMKPNSILINTSRGNLIDPDALYSALSENVILGAGIDTHSSEPLPKDSKFFKLDNIVLTDHSAYSSEEAVLELKTKSALNIKSVLCGELPKYSLNKIQTK